MILGSYLSILGGVILVNFYILCRRSNKKVSEDLDETVRSHVYNLRNIPRVDYSTMEDEEEEEAQEEKEEKEEVKEEVKEEIESDNSSTSYYDDMPPLIPLSTTPIKSDVPRPDPNSEIRRIINTLVERDVWTDRNALLSNVVQPVTDVGGVVEELEAAVMAIEEPVAPVMAIEEPVIATERVSNPIISIDDKIDVMLNTIVNKVETIASNIIESQEQRQEQRQEQKQEQIQRQRVPPPPPIRSAPPPPSQGVYV